MQENCLRVLKAYEKRLLLNLTLQNLELEGEKVRFNWINPFDKIANLASRQAWLERWDDYRKTDWSSELEYLEFTSKEVNRFLAF